MKFTTRQQQLQFYLEYFDSVSKNLKEGEYPALPITPVTYLQSLDVHFLWILWNACKVCGVDHLKTSISDYEDADEIEYNLSNPCDWFDFIDDIDGKLATGSIKGYHKGSDKPVVTLVADLYHDRRDIYSYIIDYCLNPCTEALVNDIYGRLEDLVKAFPKDFQPKEVL